MKKGKDDTWQNDNFFFSFLNAIRGIIHIINHHYNARLIFLFAVLAVLAGFYLKISRLEMFVLGSTVMTVFITEVINTVIEDIADLINKDFHPKIKIVKDVAAGVVLVAALFSLCVGYFIFVERILGLRK